MSGLSYSPSLNSFTSMEDEGSEVRFFIRIIVNLITIGAVFLFYVNKEIH